MNFRFWEDRLDFDENQRRLVSRPRTGPGWTLIVLVLSAVACLGMALAANWEVLR